MLPSPLNKIGHTSCIKLFGVPILPPLITEERRKELNNDKQRAVEIEKKLKGKRSSIDSGVMTGSYIEHFRNIESQQTDEFSHIEHFRNIESQQTDKFSHNLDLPLQSSFESVIPQSSYDVSDSFLKTALEDPEFREFFSATADKIFKDNKMKDITNSNNGDSSASCKVNHVPSTESEIQALEVYSEPSFFLKSSESVNVNFSDTQSRVPSVVESDITLKRLEDSEGIVNEPYAKEKEELPLHPRIRRNSYTLESPSPVLLEHLAKEMASDKEEAEKWQSLQGEKDRSKGLGFKTFSGKSPRKLWIKKTLNLSSSLRVENPATKYTLGRSNTFVKHDPKTTESNYSLPCSSRTSPLQLCSFTRSVDCIKSMVVNQQCELNKDVFDVRSEYENKVNNSQIPFENTVTLEASDSETYNVQKDYELQSGSLDTSPTSKNNNPSCNAQSTSSKENCSPPQIEFSDSASQISFITQPTYLQEISACVRNISNKNVLSVVDHPEDLDDLASLCSSLSISRFLPTNDVSRPSTAEDLSEANIRLLKMKHEHELRELLEKQRKEEEIYSQILSSSGSITSRTTTNLSFGDPFDSSSEVLLVDKKDSCSRELFPFQKSSPIQIHPQQKDYSEREKEAAARIIACVKGYLTRRLLKTEKVQKLIEVIKESLTCAFSLQLEPFLKPNDLELHARLAEQLNTALKELQSIVFAPVAARMAIIAADRERLRRPVSRPSSTVSTISSATRKSILRRQQSLTSTEKKPRESRTRTKSFSIHGNTGSRSSESRVRSDSASTVSTNSSRVPWR